MNVSPLQFSGKHFVRFEDADGRRVECLTYQQRAILISRAVKTAIDQKKCGGGFCVDLSANMVRLAGQKNAPAKVVQASYDSFCRRMHSSLTALRATHMLFTDEDAANALLKDSERRDHDIYRKHRRAFEKSPPFIIRFIGVTPQIAANMVLLLQSHYQVLIGDKPLTAFTLPTFWNRQTLEQEMEYWQ